MTTRRRFRICVDGRYLENPSFGISVYLICVLQALAEAGADIDLIVRRPIQCVDELPSSVDVIELPAPSSFIWEQWSAMRHIRAGDYDAYLCPSNVGLPVLGPRRTHMMLTVHDLIPLHFPVKYLLRRPRWAVRYLRALALSSIRADAIFTPSRWAADDVLARLHRHATPVLTNVSGRHRHDGHADVDSRRMPEGHDAPPYLLFNGGRDPRKNLTILLDAFARLVVEHPDDLHVLKLMGPGYEASVSSLGAAVRARVELLGYVTEGEKGSIVARAAAIVYPSTMEGFGLPIVEGLMAGVPVICGTGGSQRELGGDAVVYVDPIDTETLYRALRTVLIDGERPTPDVVAAQVARVAAPNQSVVLAATFIDSIRRHVDKYSARTAAPLVRARS